MSKPANKSKLIIDITNMRGTKMNAVVHYSECHCIMDRVLLLIGNRWWGQTGGGWKQGVHLLSTATYIRVWDVQLEESICFLLLTWHWHYYNLLLLINIVMLLVPCVKLNLVFTGGYISFNCQHCCSTPKFGSGESSYGECADGATTNLIALHTLR
jgi:hypothetical protein